MKILIDIYHPAHVHQFKYIVRELIDAGHDVKVLAIKKDVTVSLLKANNIPYSIISDSSGKGMFQKAIIGLGIFWKVLRISLDYSPDIFIGRPCPPSSLCSFILRKPHLNYADDDEKQVNVSNKLCTKLFKASIITPMCFRYNYGLRHIKVDAYKELFYLHPDVYAPNPHTIQTYNLPQNGYIIVRFVGWTAYHDVNQHGIRDKIALVEKLAKLKDVIIVSEGTLDKRIQKFQMHAPPEAFHDILANASMLIGDSQTTTTEAAMLGVPAIRCNSWVGENDAGVFKELESKYGLIYNVSDEDTILEIAKELLSNPDLKDEWKKKRDVMLDGKVNMTKYFLELIYKTAGEKKSQKAA